MESCVIYYSDRYRDRNFEYRHVTIPVSLLAFVKKNKLLEEHEWRSIGIQQSRGWEHYCIHPTEPHVLPFRRRIPQTS